MMKRLKAALILLAAVLLFPHAANAIQSQQVQDGINLLTSKGLVGQRLVDSVLQRTNGIMGINRPYLYDGVGDCYGFVSQVWNPLLSDGTNHPEEFYTSSYSASQMYYWAKGDAPRKLPRGDGLYSPDWAPVSSIGKDNLKVGDVLGTTQGHVGGDNVHYGMYAGKANGVHSVFQNYYPSGAYKTTYYEPFLYYYKPIHEILSRSSVALNHKEFQPGLLARKASDGTLWFYKGDGTGKFSGSVQAGQNWNGMDIIIGVGDFNKDGHNDIIARNKTSNYLYLYKGTGNSGFQNALFIGNGWETRNAIIGVSDFNGDKLPDLIARGATDGILYLYPGDGKGGFGNTRVIGNGWRDFDMIIAAGDFNGDGFADIIARKGQYLYLYPGLGNNLFGNTRTIGTGFDKFDMITGVGDFNGDGFPDLIARETSTKTLYLYPGNGKGGFLDRSPIGFNWGAFDRIFGIGTK